MMTDERRDQIEAKRTEMIDSIRDKADRELNDERFAAPFQKLCDRSPAVNRAHHFFAPIIRWPIRTAIC